MSTVSDIERVVDEVAEWGADIIVELVKRLSDGGRPYGMPERTPEEQLIEYLPIREDPDAAFMYMSNKLDELMQSLGSSGASEVAISAIHPADLIASTILTWSSNMEDLIKTGKYDVAKLGPTKPMTPPVAPDMSPPPGYNQTPPSMPAPVALQ